MARRRRSAAATRIVRVGAPRAPAPVIRIQQPRAAPLARRRRTRRRSSGGARSSIGGLSANYNIDVAIGGALYGFAVKNGWVEKLPAIPVVGRTGTAAILLYWWGKRGGGDLVKRTGIAAAALAGYQLGSTGSIMGEDGYPMVSDGFQTTGSLGYIEDVEGDDEDDD